jgi:GGDEF domain-containing protein
VAYCSFESGAIAGHDIELGEQLFRSADAALYQAKERGRNHVHVAPPCSTNVEMTPI